MDSDGGLTVFSRRQALGLAATAAVGLGVSEVASRRTRETPGQGTPAQQTPPEPDFEYRLHQGDRCLDLTAVPGAQSVTDFYNWQAAGTDYSSLGTTDIQRPRTSLLFLYEGPDGTLSLVLIHGAHGDEESGSVSFRFRGLPPAGTWTVRDDSYNEETNHDNWLTGGTAGRVDWTSKAGRTDGGAYGPVGDDFEIAIEPLFNEAATLYGKEYTGRITEWQALSGPLDDPDRFTLAMDRPVELAVDRCGASDPVTTSEGTD